MNKMIVVIGFGPVGRATTEALLAQGTTVRVAQRTRPADLPPHVAFRPCDVANARSVSTAIEGADQVVVAIGLPYDGAVWRRTWPLAMTNLIEACAATGARMVFVDGLYMLGPQREPLREDMPLTTFGVKPAVRSEVTRIWMAATSRVRVAALRAPDFYGPGVANSHLGDTAFGALAKGKTATLVAPPDTPHDFAYVPDIARAVIALLDAPDDAFGQIWNMPCAPTRTPREIFALGATALGASPKLLAVPLWMLPLIGLFVPFLREVVEMRFTLDRPYRVDAGKFTRRFAFAATPFEIGAPATARAFRDAAKTPT
ncbi:NAD-dependent epimerase/dehydratase family protein [Beijerinckia sp. L45]|uniref:NAD-dependent epimerase/dehydratase family protein n=1 Tax=Beijerinckia sp. L45 TaxID=1641855 RepID=UPI00131CC799|nr:NAD-dependent epimerase/dehydratase family protein [Beijerinckia sp. L45]